MLFLVLLVAVGAGRLFEMRLSRRHQRALQALCEARANEPRFRRTVAAAVGVLALRRPCCAALAAAPLAMVVLANMLRWG